MQVPPVSAESLPGLLLRRSEKLKQAIAEPPQIDALQTQVLNLHAAGAPDPLSGTHRLLPLIVFNPPDRMARSQWSSRNMVFSGDAAGHFLRNWTNGRRHDQATHEQGLRVY